MILTKSLAALAVALAWLVVGARPAVAEWSLDLYGGWALTQSHHISLDGDLDSTDVAGLLKGVSFAKSFSGGGRVGVLVPVGQVLRARPRRSAFSTGHQGSDREGRGSDHGQQGCSARCPDERQWRRAGKAHGS